MAGLQLVSHEATSCTPMGHKIRYSPTASAEAASKHVLVPAARRALHSRLPSSAGRCVKGAADSDRALCEWSSARRSTLSSAFDASTVEHWSSSRVLESDLCERAQAWYNVRSSQDTLRLRWSPSAAAEMLPLPTSWTTSTPPSLCLQRALYRLGLGTHLVCA